MSDNTIDDIQYQRNVEMFKLKHPGQRLFSADPKTPAEILGDIEERDRRLILILAALPSPIAYEFLQTVAGNRDDYTLQGIAKRCGISRSTLNRLLVSAREVVKAGNTPPGIGSSKTQKSGESTRRGRAHRATNAAKKKNNNKKGDKQCK